MPDFILLMHKDVSVPEDPDAWEPYIARLNQLDAFGGGSSIGPGQALRKSGAPGPAADHLAGYLRVQAPTLANALALMEGNPTFEAGGTVEVRELPKD
jgi:hypothetical protein